MPRAMPPLHMQILPRIRKMRGKSTLTIYKTRGCVVRLCKLIYKLYGLQNIHHISHKHIIGAFNELQQQGLSKSTLASYATAARLIADHVGRPEIVPPNSKIGAVRTTRDRYKPVSEPNEEVINNVRQKLYERSTWLGLAHDMRVAFGLRTKESLLSVETININGIHHLIVKGAKGGRPRIVPILTEQQRQAITAVQNFLEQNPEWTSLIPPTLSLKQALGQQKTILNALGATRQNRANAHVLRHTFAQRFIAAMPQEYLTFLLGHGRTNVLRHYVPRDLLKVTMTADDNMTTPTPHTPPESAPVQDMQPVTAA